MDPPSHPPNAPRPPAAIDDARPSTPPRPLINGASLVWVLVFAFCQFFLAGMAGVGSDLHRFTMPKKLLLTGSASLALVLVIAAAIGRRQGCATGASFFALFVLCQLVAIWFWN